MQIVEGASLETHDITIESEFSGLIRKCSRGHATPLISVVCPEEMLHDPVLAAELWTRAIKRRTTGTAA